MRNAAVPVERRPTPGYVFGEDRHMEEITITLDDEVAAQVRQVAAASGKTVSGYVAGLVSEQLPVVNDQRSALERLDALPLWDLTDENGRLPSREEMYAERTGQLLRRHQRPSISQGQERDEEA